MEKVEFNIISSLHLIASIFTIVGVVFAYVQYENYLEEKQIKDVEALERQRNIVGGILQENEINLIYIEDIERKLDIYTTTPYETPQRFILVSTENELENGIILDKQILSDLRITHAHLLQVNRMLDYQLPIQVTEENYEQVLAIKKDKYLKINKVLQEDLMPTFDRNMKNMLFYFYSINEALPPEKRCIDCIPSSIMNMTPGEIKIYLDSMPIDEIYTQFTRDAYIQRYSTLPPF